jgi:hypothetical protein
MQVIRGIFALLLLAGVFGALAALVFTLFATEPGMFLLGSAMVAFAYLLNGAKRRG